MLVTREQLNLINGKSFEVIRQEAAVVSTLSEYSAQQYIEKLGYDPLAMLLFLQSLKRPLNL